MSFVPKPHEIYKHFKGNLYRIVAIARHTETDERLVIYQALYGDSQIYARPLEMFVSRVDREKYPDAAQTFRFELQGDDSGRQLRENGGIVKADVEEQSVEEVKDREEAMAEEPSAVFDKGSEEAKLDPMVLEFLDSDSYAKKLNILAGIHHRITDDMITTMAVACDIEVNEGDTEERYASLRKCLLTLEKYECNRLR